LPDSQAGHFCFELRGFLGSKDEQGDSSRQRKSAEYWRSGNSVMFFCRGVDRPNIQNLFLVRIRESLIREDQDAKNYKKNSNPNNRFHMFHLQATFRSMGLEPARLQEEPRRHLASLNVGLG
jgi:hypothetical protein